MLTSTILNASALTSMPNQPLDKRPAILVQTALGAGQTNSFYIALVDEKNNPVDPKEMEVGDSISWDHREGLHTVALWKNRVIRQFNESFDIATITSDSPSDDWANIPPVTDPFPST